jgi:hypothetical protein
MTASVEYRNHIPGKEKQMSWNNNIKATAADLAGKARQNITRLGKSSPRRGRGSSGSGGKSVTGKLKAAFTG